MFWIFILGVAFFFVMLIVSSIVFVSKNKNNFNNEKGTLDMLKNGYIYVVLFTTLMMSIGGSVGVFMSVADYISPPNYYQTFEDYKNMKQLESKEMKKPTLTEEELKESYEDTVALEKQKAKENALNQIIKSLGWIIIPLPIFVFFQRQVRKNNNNTI
jgi:hypothetical protein